jgi:hypothetical protein
MAHGDTKGPGETDSSRKTYAENLVSDSLSLLSENELNLYFRLAGVMWK